MTAILANNPQQIIVSAMEADGPQEKGTSFNYEIDANKEYENLSDDEYEYLDVYQSSNTVSMVINSTGDYTEVKEHEVTSLSRLSTASFAFSDVNENNDTFVDASTVYKAGQDNGHYGNYVHWYATISQKKSGWWLWEKTYIDKDFYSFDVTVTGTLEIGLQEIPVGTDYDLRVFKLGNTLETSSLSLDFNTTLPIAKGEKLSNADEYIKVNVSPGTYYAAVYSWKDLSFNNDIPYKIWFQQIQNTSSPNNYYNITNGRISGDLGALWISDYMPLGISPVTLTDSNAKVYFQNYDEYPMIRHLAERYQAEDIEYATLYIWDLTAKAAIYSLLSTVLSSVVAFNPWLENEIKNVNISLNASGIVFSVGGLIVSIISLQAWAAAAAAVLTGAGIAIGAIGLVIGIVSLLFTIYMDAPYSISKAGLREYLINAKSAFEIGPGSTNLQVVQLKFRYHFGKDNRGDFFDFSPIYRNTDNNLYNKSVINYIDNNSSINGTVVGFDSIEDLENFIK